MRNEKTKIEFDYDDKHYRLEFTADSLKKMEQSGVDFSELGKKTLSAPEDLFCGLFIANHSNTPVRVRKEIYKSLVRHSEDDGCETEEDGLNAVMVAMFTEAVEEIRGRGNEGNTKWKIVR